VRLVRASSTHGVTHLPPLVGPGARWAQEVELRDAIRGVIERFHEALNTQDLEALGDLVHEDCVFETTDPPDGTRHVGRAAVLAACKEFLAQSPQAQFEMEETVTVDDRAFVRWRYAWADGHVRGVDVMRVQGGKVIETFAT
jgi:uncharacterized protein (TIGR02246 family)